MVHPSIILSQLIIIFSITDRNKKIQHCLITKDYNIYHNDNYERIKYHVSLPAKVGLPTIQNEAYGNDHNDEVLARDLDLNEKEEKMQLYEWSTI